MAILVTQLKNEVEAFRRTNAFTPGDAGSFSIPLIRGEIELPGKYDPKKYLYDLQIMDLTDKRVAVMFPGNGGLCIEAINLGAVDVWAVEPRNNYAKALSTFSTMISQVKGRAFTTAANLNEFVEMNGKFDVVLWSEGLEQLKNPVAILTSVWKLLAPGGKLFIEVVHGEHEIPTRAINQWKPKEAVFAQVLKGIIGDAPVRSMNGRLQRRTIYEVTNPVQTPPAPTTTQPGIDVEVALKVESTQVDQTPTDTQEAEKPKRSNMKKKRG